MSKKYMTIFLAILLILTYTNTTKGIENIDVRVRGIVNNTNTKHINSFMGAVTKLGDASINYSIGASLPNKEIRKNSMKSIILAGVTTQILKIAIGKSRPPGPIEYNPFTISSRNNAMPSGHTATAFALATSIADYYPKYKYLSYTIATLVGISRLYKDMHWFTDVIAGAGVGYASAKIVQIKF